MGNERSMLDNTTKAAVLDKIFLEVDHLVADHKDHPLFDVLGSKLATLRKQVGHLVEEMVVTKETLTTLKTSSLPESETQFRLMADATPIMIRMTDVHKMCTFFNKSWLQFTGRTMEEELGYGWIQDIHPDDVERVAGTYERSFEVRQNFSIEYRLRCADGTYCWIIDNGTPRYLTDGSFAGYIGSCMNIHDRKEAEERIKKADDHLLEVQRMAKIANFNWDLQQDHIEWGDEFFNIVERNPQSIPRNLMGFTHLLHPDDRAKTEDIILNAVWHHTRPYAEFRFVMPDGSIKYIYCEGKVEYDRQGTPLRMVGLVQDITERKQAEERLRNSEYLYRTLCQNFPNGAIMVLDRDLKFTFMEGKELANLGNTAGTFVGKSIFTTSPATAPYTSQFYKRSFEGEATTFEINYANHHYSVSTIPLADENGEINHVMAVSQNITERKQAEEKIRQSEARFRRLSDSGMMGVTFWTTKGAIIEANDTFLEWFGYTREELQENGLSWAEMTPPEYQHIDTEKIAEARQIGFCTPYEKEMLRKDGTPMPIMITYALLEGMDEQGICCVFDITERRQAEEKLRYSEQLYKAIAVNFPHGTIMIFDQALTLTFIAGKELTDMDLSADMFVGKTLEQLLPPGKAELYRTHYGRALGGQPTSFQDYVFDNHYDLYALPLPGEGGDIEQVMVFSVNITGQKQAQEKLQQSEHLYKAIAQNLPNGTISLIDKSLRISFIEGKELQHFGVTPEMMVGKTLFDLIDEELASKAYGALEEVLAGKSIVAEIEFAGRSYWVSTVPLYNEATGEITQLMSLAQNVTPLKIAQESTLKYARKSISILESITDAMISVDKEWNYVYVNKEAERLLQVNRDDLLDKNMWELFPPKEHFDFYCQYQYAVCENVAAHFEAFLNSLELWLEVHAYPSPEGLSIYFRDIGERKATEFKLNHRLELEKMLSTISTSFINVNLKELDRAISKALATVSRFLEIDHAAVSIFDDELSKASFYEWGTEDMHSIKDQLIGIEGEEFTWWRTKLEALAPVHIPDVKVLPAEAAAEQALFNRLSIRSVLGIPIVYNNRLAGYIIFNVMQQERAWATEDIVLLRIMGEVFGNALQRRQHEQEIVAQKEYLRQIIDTVPNLVFVKDVGGNLLMYNEAFTNLTGFPAGESTLCCTTDDPETLRVYEQQNEAYLAVDREVITTHRTVVIEESYTHPQTGKTTLLLTTKKPLISPDGTINVLGVSVDITERKMALERLRQSEADLKEAQRISRFGSWDFDISRGKITWTEEVFRIHGLDPAAGEPSFETLLTTYMEHEKMEKYINDAIQQGTPYEFDTKIRVPGGGVKHIHVIGKPVMNNKGICTRLYGTVMDITERKLAEQRVQHRLDIENLISSISAQFINISSGELDPAILNALERVGLFSGAERAFVFTLDFKEKTQTNTHEWCSDGLMPLRDRLQGVPFDPDSWGLRKFKKFETLFIPRLSDMPPEAEKERSSLELSQVKSYIAVPLVFNNELIGYVGFFSMTEERAWAEEDVILLKMLAEIFGGAMQRKKVEEELIHQKQFLRHVIDAAPNLIYVKDSSGKMLMVNQAMAELTGLSTDELLVKNIEFYGNSTEATVMRQNEIHAMDTMQTITLEESFTNEQGETKFFLSTKKPIVLPDGRLNILGIAVDITERKKAEEKIKQSEQLFHAVFNNSTDALFMVEPGSFTVRDCNDVAVAMFAAGSKEELVGTKGYKLQKRDFVPEQIKEILASLEHTGSWSSEMEYRARDGREFWGNLALKMLQVGNQKLQLVRVTDINERKQSEINMRRSEQLLQAVFNNSADALFLVNAETQLIEDCNSVALSMFGLEGKEKIVNMHGNLMRKSPPGQQELAMMQEHLENNMAWHSEVEYIRQDDGHVFWGNLAIRRFEAGSRNLDLARISDITERKRAEAELIEAKERAEEMNRLKSRFLANMSHEIRTPLNGILGMAQVIAAESQEENTCEYAHIIEESGQRLLSTINDILDLSKIEAQKTEMQLTVCNIRKVADKISKSLKVLADRKYLAFEVQHTHDDVKAFIDERLLGQILNNLIGNAIKFTEHGGITVVTRATADENGVMMASIQVKDTGIGIGKDYFPKLFTPFSQASTGHGRKYHGTGLGLTISKSFVELMGGRIIVESREGEGSIFEVQFPLCPSFDDSLDD